MEGRQKKSKKLIKEILGDQRITVCTMPHLRALTYFTKKPFLRLGDEF